MRTFEILLYTGCSTFKRAVERSQNQGGQYCQTKFGLYNPSPAIITPIKIKKSVCIRVIHSYVVNDKIDNLLLFRPNSESFGK